MHFAVVVEFCLIVGINVNFTDKTFELLMFLCISHNFMIL